MKFWTDLEKDDIDLSDDGKEIHISYQSNNQGNWYVSVKTQDIRDLLKTLDSKEKV
jgi:hypothetical protein